MDQINNNQRQQRPTASRLPSAATVQRPTAPATSETSRSRYLVLALIALAAIVVLAGAGFMYSSSTQPAGVTGVDGSRYQAVFMNNGQVYFGKLTAADADTLRLTEIYYVNVTQKIQPEEAPAEDEAVEPQLIKLGEELHGPDDEMFIDRDQVSFWENLKDEGKVVQAIKSYTK